jgi:hypothetical protein
MRKSKHSLSYVSLFIMKKKLKITILGGGMGMLDLTLG